jgi:NSS family neurotransmitter:Na+ symporter
MLLISWGFRALPLLADHLNHNGSVHIGTWWRVLISVVAPAALAYILIEGFITDVETAYEGYPQWMLLTFGWGAAAAVVVLGFLATTIPWRSETSMEAPPSAADAADTRGGN